jgi:hypothetical protein
MTQAYEQPLDNTQELAMEDKLTPVVIEPAEGETGQWQVWQRPDGSFYKAPMVNTEAGSAEETAAPPPVTAASDPHVVSLSHHIDHSSGLGSMHIDGTPEEMFVYARAMEAAHHVFAGTPDQAPSVKSTPAQIALPAYSRAPILDDTPPRIAPPTQSYPRPEYNDIPRQPVQPHPQEGRDHERGRTNDAGLGLFDEPTPQTQPARNDVPPSFTKTAGRWARQKAADRLAQGRRPNQVGGRAPAVHERKKLPRLRATGRILAVTGAVVATTGSIEYHYMTHDHSNLIPVLYHIGSYVVGSL